MASGAAFFDVDGTIINATIVHYYVYYRTSGYSDLKRRIWMIGFFPKIIYYFFLDKINRSYFIKRFYLQYQGFQHEECLSKSEQLFKELISPRLFAGAVERIRNHQKNGDKVVLVTGSLDFIMEPLVKYIKADKLIALTMKVKHGRLTGETIGDPIGDNEKARIVLEYAEEHSIVLAQSYAYADSSSDLPLLNLVGNAIVINPGNKLKKIADANGWETVRWSQV
tara:strand:+ start:53855 stop:54526 length:672 start_codon:yes stop_codon:yes gene_type:complete